MTKTGLRPYIARERLDEMTKRLASEIDSDFRGKQPVLVGVLKGAFIFFADLSRKLEAAHEVDFIQAACYGMRDTPSNEVLILRDITSEIKGRDVVVVEDIIDRGHTARVLVEYFTKKGAASVRLCAMLLRSGGAPGLKVDYVGFEIGKGFVVGYGMDYKEMYRGLPALFLLEDG